MIYLKKFNEGIRCDYCNGEGREPSCHMCGKVYDYSDELDDDDDVYPQIQSTDISDDEMREAADEWVFDKNSWSNNDDSAGDNFGSFMAGAKWMLNRLKK